jgi:hypothetical protein
MKGQLDVMLRDEEPHFVLTEKLAPPIFHPVVAGNDSLGVAAWNIPYINSGKSVARNITVNTYMSLDYAPFIRSNSLLGGSRRAMTSSQQTTLRSSSLRPSGYGCVLMSPRPKRKTLPSKGKTFHSTTK